MVAPLVVSLMVTDCAAVNVPGAGEKVGVAACGLIVYAAEAAALVENPLAVAMALMVSCLGTHRNGACVQRGGGRRRISVSGVVDGRIGRGVRDGDRLPPGIGPAAGEKVGVAAGGRLMV